MIDEYLYNVKNSTNFSYILFKYKSILQVLTYSFKKLLYIETTVKLKLFMFPNTNF